MPLLLRLKLIFFALLLGDFGVFVMRRRVAFQNFPIALHLIMATRLRFVDALFLAPGDRLPLCFQVSEPRIHITGVSVRG